MHGDDDFNDRLTIREECSNRIRRHKNKSSFKYDDYSNDYLMKSLIFGLVTGFVVKVVSLGAYAYMLMLDNQGTDNQAFVQQIFGSYMDARYNFDPLVEITKEGRNDSFSSSSSLSGASVVAHEVSADAVDEGKFLVAQSSFITQKTFLHILLWILTNLTWIVHALIICIAIMYTCIRLQFSSSSSSSSSLLSYKKYNKNKTKSKNSNILVLLKYFSLGIGIGTFMVLSWINVFLGFPIPLEKFIISAMIHSLLVYFFFFCDLLSAIFF